MDGRYLGFLLLGAAIILLMIVVGFLNGLGDHRG